MNRNCLFCFPEDAFGPNEFIEYLQFSKSYFFPLLCFSCNRVYWCIYRRKWKATFQLIFKGLNIVHYPKWSCSDHIKKNAFCGKKTRCTSDPTPVSVRNSCFGGEPVILISNENNSYDFLLEGRGPGRWPSTLSPWAVPPAQAAHARSDLLKGSFQEGNASDLVWSLFQEKARPSWWCLWDPWCNQLMLVPAFSAALLPPMVRFPCAHAAPAQGLPWNCLWEAAGSSATV